MNTLKSTLVILALCVLSACSHSKQSTQSAVQNFGANAQKIALPTKAPRSQKVAKKAREKALSKQEQQQIVCLADALHYEAKPNPTGFASVAEVIFARAEKSDKSVCQVIYAYRYCRNGKCKKAFHHGRNPGKYKGWKPVAQFSYITEGHPYAWKHKNKAHRTKWAEKSFPAAQHLYKDWRAGVKTYLPKVQKAVDGATHYHANYVKPAWRKKLRKTASAGGHKFYKSKETVFAFAPQQNISNAQIAIEGMIK